MLQTIGQFGVVFQREEPFTMDSAPYNGLSEEHFNLEVNECLVVRGMAKRGEPTQTTYQKIKILENNEVSQGSGYFDQTGNVSVRTYEGRQYLYGVTKGADIVLEWVKSIAIFIGNIFHNIFIKCIKVLVIKCLAACGVQFKAEVIEKTDRMWEAGTPWKALIGLVVQIVLNILSIVSLGLFTTELNRLSGYVEMKILDHDGSDLTRRRRLMEKDYLAPCQQPFAVIAEGEEFSQADLKASMVARDTFIDIVPCISANLKRAVVPMILGTPCGKSIPLSYANF